MYVCSHHDLHVHTQSLFITEIPLSQSIPRMHIQDVFNVHCIYGWTKKTNFFKDDILLVSLFASGKKKCLQSKGIDSASRHIGEEEEMIRFPVITIPNM